MIALKAFRIQSSSAVSALIWITSSVWCDSGVVGTNVTFIYQNDILEWVHTYTWVLNIMNVDNRRNNFKYYI